MFCAPVIFEVMDFGARVCIFLLKHPKVCIFWVVFRLRGLIFGVSALGPYVFLHANSSLHAKTSKSACFLHAFCMLYSHKYSRMMGVGRGAGGAIILILGSGVSFW